MNKDDGSRYRYGEFPLCAFCAEFYGFYFDDPGQKKREKNSSPQIISNYLISAKIPTLVSYA
ncbi:hypothetical protein [Methanobacterium petrolearium]|uniref:hypothetical protein n=1 Tax=Methanobacterium petrolearium TaxID=710190 RepID=UPI003081EB8D|nr:hypothetical protein GCM10025861_08630 [Methanobacterium petrolearium]